MMKLSMKQPSHTLLLLLWVFCFSASANNAEPVRKNVPSYHSGGGIAAFRECRFLSLRSDQQEKRLEMTAPRREMLFALLHNTNVGRLVISELERFKTTGVGDDPAKKLRFYEVIRDQGPAAEYFENGELHINARVFDALTSDPDSYTSAHFTSASFVVHEAVHAMAHHLHLKNEFSPYQANTKVNEALAYFIQGLYLDEIKVNVKDYKEGRATPAWDRCTVRIISILNKYGIDDKTPSDEAYDLLTELQLEADEDAALRLSKLWQYYQFLDQSDEADNLWYLNPKHLPKQKVVETVTDVIWLDVERRNCDFDNTFSLMRNRIILYANYADTPLDTTTCEYFTGFVSALRSEGTASQLLRDEIDNWLVRRGIRPAHTPAEPYQ